MDFSPILAPGAGVSRGTLEIFTNTASPVPADQDWQVGEVVVYGRALYAVLGGGSPGIDYQLQWTAYDTDGNQWPRTGLVLCAPTS
jgi:hypothetical protein